MSGTGGAVGDGGGASGGSGSCGGSGGYGGDATSGSLPSPPPGSGMGRVVAISRAAWVAGFGAQSGLRAPA